jgi:tryptophan synthase alpha chain
MTRIEKQFARLKSEGRKGFIPYITAGDPSLEITLELVLALEAAGADVIELGVPFSDPIADGPVIQRATERALHNGVTLRKVLQLGENIRKKSEIALVLSWLGSVGKRCRKIGFRRRTRERSYG